MRKIAKILVLSLLTVGMTVSCGGRKPSPSSEATPSSQQGTSNNPSSDVSSNPESKPDSSVAPISSSEAQSSLMSSSSSNAPISSSEAPNSSAQASSSVEPSSSAQPSSSQAPVAIGITVNADAVKKTYTVGENFDTTGLIVNVNMSDGTSLPVTNYTTNPANGAVLDEAGEKDVAVNYLTFNETFKITVNPRPKVLTGISLNTDNVKKEYFEGENLDLTGLVVNANYDDNSSEEVNDYTADPADGTALNVIGEKEIVISYNGFEDNFKVNVTKAPKTAWTEEEAKIMADHLYGEVLPFNGLEESVVEYDDAYDIVIISGGAVTNDDIIEYIGELEDVDWYIYDSTDTDYALQKPLETELGGRMLYMYLTIDEGEFYLEASDPYLYEFPSDYAEEWAYDYFGSDQIAPAIDADYYEVDEYNMSIYCYLDATNDDAGYSAILTIAGWDVQDKGDDGFYVASSPDGLYEVAYAYGNDALVIYIEPLSFWNTAVVEAFFTQYSGGIIVDIPALNVEEAMYQFMQSQYNDAYYQAGYYQYIIAQMVIYGCDLNDLDDYLDVLDVAGWDITETGTDEYSCKLLIDDEGYGKIEVSYDSDYSAIVILIYWALDPLPAAEWPADEIAEFLGTGITDVVPEFEGDNNGFTVLDDSYGFAIMVSVDKDKEEDALEDYVDTLTVALYTEYRANIYGDMQYLSPNGEILVCPYIGTVGSITISIKAFNPFPYEECQDALVDCDDTITDDVIGMDCASDYYIYTDGVYVQAQCFYDSLDEAYDALDLYVEIMNDSEYEYMGVDNYGSDTFESPNEQFYITAWVYSSSYALILDITPGVFVPPLTGWPFDEIAAFIGETLARELPVYDENIVYTVSTSNYADFSISCAVEDKTTAAKEYRNILLENEWVENGTDSYGDMHYLSPSGKLDVNPSDGYTGSNMVIEVNVMPDTAWPTSDVNALCEKHHCKKDTIPAFDGGEDATYKIDENYSYANAAIIVTCSNSSSLTSAYYDVLEGENWVDSGTDGYGQQTYTSPNGEIKLSFWIQSSAVNIEIFWLKDTNWPIDDLADCFDDFGFNDPLPAFEGECESATAYADAEKIIVDVVIDGDEDDFEDAFADYCGTLEDNNFTFESEDIDGVHYLSPNAEYEVVVGVSDEGFFVWCIPFEEPGDLEFTSFPMSLILEYYPEAQDIFPAIEGGINYRVSSASDQDYFELYVDFDNAMTAQNASEEFLATIIGYGYTLIDVEGSDGYLSPDGSFVIMIYDVYSSDEGQTYVLPIDIMTAGIL